MFTTGVKLFEVTMEPFHPVAMSPYSSEGERDVAINTEHFSLRFELSNKTMYLADRNSLVPGGATHQRME